MLTNKQLNLCVNTCRVWSQFKRDMWYSHVSPIKPANPITNPITVARLKLMHSQLSGRVGVSATHKSTTIWQRRVCLSISCMPRRCKSFARVVRVFMFASAPAAALRSVHIITRLTSSHFIWPFPGTSQDWLGRVFPKWRRFFCRVWRQTYISRNLNWPPVIFLSEPSALRQSQPRGTRSIHSARLISLWLWVTNHSALSWDKTGDQLR